MRYAMILTMLTLTQTGAAQGGRLYLAKDGVACCGIVTDSPDSYAVERLTQFIRQAAPDLPAPAREWTPARPGVCIVVGALGTTGLAGAVCGEAGLHPPALTDQGYMAKTVRYRERDCLLLAGGGAAGVQYAVTDLINWRASNDGKTISIPAVDVRQEPRFMYRWFWNWDHRMDWGGPGAVGTEMGGGGTYSKQPEAFVTDCKRCIDYMADHKFNGLILWGFLRDTHGGIEASREVCRYAAHRCVRLLPGVGTSGYAGYYFEGRHEFNADTWLGMHPELSAIEEDGTPKKDHSPCPSKKANQDWLDRGAKWLFDTFEIGGVNLEMGDFYVCYCDDCKRARAAIESDEPDYYKDMAISHAQTIQTMRAIAPDAWLSYATYTGYNAKMMETPPKFLSMIPDYALCQWTLTGMAGKWPADVKPMAKHNVGYLHWCNRSTKTQDDYYLEQVRAICRNAAAAGFEGLATYGELNADKPNVGLCYLAWEAFLWDPEMTIETFFHERMEKVFGPEPAKALLEKAGVQASF